MCRGSQEITFDLRLSLAACSHARCRLTAPSAILTPLIYLLVLILFQKKLFAFYSLILYTNKKKNVIAPLNMVTYNPRRRRAGT